MPFVLSYLFRMAFVRTKSYLYSVKRYYLSLCFGTSQHHLYYQAVRRKLSGNEPTAQHFRFRWCGDHSNSERTYNIQLQAYDLPTRLRLRSRAN